MMEPWRFLIGIAVLNITLSGLHFILDWLKARHVNDESALKFIESMQRTLEWLMANRK